MGKHSLDKFIETLQRSWGRLSSELVVSCSAHLEELLKAPASEAWLATLHRDARKDHELYRDPVHGFMLLAHTEEAGLYRRPHDHGRGGGIYAVLSGAIEMATYMALPDERGTISLVKRDSTLVRAGELKVFLPGDIHDTRCVTGPALLFRFTDRDLKKEDKEERRVTRYVERGGVWTASATQ